jgi:hypothetical protein
VGPRPLRTLVSLALLALRGDLDHQCGGLRCPGEVILRQWPVEAPLVVSLAAV